MKTFFTGISRNGLRERVKGSSGIAGPEGREYGRRDSWNASERKGRFFRG
jgi:hypothetical protein